jgi:cell wall-associated NlpC family hydrolase
VTADPRLLPARGDIAAAHLKGLVEAERFVEGETKQVIAAAATLRRTLAPDARLETQLLYGEAFHVYEEKDGFAWGQAAMDSCVGYVSEKLLTAPVIKPTHRVSVLRTILFSAPDIKSAPLAFLSLNAKPAIAEEKGRFARNARGGWLIAAHLDPINAKRIDYVAAAELFLGAPYLWGGKDSLGLDCSGLIQSALERAGIAAPRDADMQEEALGVAMPFGPELNGLRRGDLVFWNGHAGIMLDGERLIHANAFHMQVAIEPLRTAAARIEKSAGPITSIRRF